MSKGLTADSRGRAALWVRARGPRGRFLPDGDSRKATTIDRRRRRAERDYLRAVVNAIALSDVEQIARSIVEDAKGEGDTDVKVVNAAREWLGKYVLGNSRVPLDDCESMPAIVKRR